MPRAASTSSGPKRFHHVVSPTPRDCRNARDQLGWTTDQLAEAAGLTLRTVLTYEQGLRTPHPRTLLAIRRALRSAGVAMPPASAPGARAG